MPLAEARMHGYSPEALIESIVGIAQRLAVEAFRQGLPAGHPSLGEALLAQGEVRVAHGRCQSAGPALEEARAVLLQALGPEDWRVEKVESLLASCRAEAANGNRDEQALR